MLRSIKYSWKSFELNLMLYYMVGILTISENLHSSYMQTLNSVFFSLSSFMLSGWDQCMPKNRIPLPLSAAHNTHKPAFQRDMGHGDWCRYWLQKAALLVSRGKTQSREMFFSVLSYVRIRCIASYQSSFLEPSWSCKIRFCGVGLDFIITSMWISVPHLLSIIGLRKCEGSLLCILHNF